MHQPLPNALPADRAKTLHALSHLLQALEVSHTPPDPHQYRLLVQRLNEHLNAAQAEGNPALPGILRTYPAVAELYENLNYHRAGLCRTTVDESVKSEMAMQTTLQRARRVAPESTPPAKP